MPEASSNKPTYNIWLPLFIAGMTAVGIYFGYKMAGHDVLDHLVEKVEEEQMGTPGRVEEIIRFIESKYVSNLDNEALIESAIEGIFTELDPHSMYLSPKSVRHLGEQMNGEYQGLGIETISYKDTVTISTVLSKSPAETAGLVFGDQIISINDSLVSGLDLDYDQIRHLMQAKKGDVMELVVMKRDTRQRRNLSIPVAGVHIPNIFGHRIEKDIAYIKIKRFNSHSYREFMEIWEAMNEDKPVNHMIIDVRHNPGGYLPETSKILSQLFKEKGKLLVYTEGSNSRKMEYKTTGKFFFDLDKLSVLVDEDSASGSEILAGAIQDWDRGIVVGRRTYGKGLVQEQYNLSNGGALRLTVAKYYTPTGRLIQRPYQDREAYDDDGHDRIVSGELIHYTENTPHDSLKFQTKEMSRDVYGGGGITPDIFIPIGEYKLKGQYYETMREIPEFCFDYLINHPELFNKSLEEFINDTQYLGSAYSEFVDFLSSNEIVLNEIDMKQNKVEAEIQAQIAHYVFGEEGKWACLTKLDEAVNQSLFHFKKKDLFAELN